MAAHTPTAPTSEHMGRGAPVGGGSHDDEEHQSFIKTPRQLLIVLALATIVPIIIIVMLASFVSSGKRFGAGADTMTPEAVMARIKPVAELVLRDASVPQPVRAGTEVYKAVCTACHEAGVAGAPKHKDTAAWAPRIGTGLDAMVTSALKGKGAMPAQGGGDYSDLEIRKAVVYMANDAGGKFEDPKQ